MSPDPLHITVLGGGPAGLAVGYYARRRGLPLTIFEASNRVGGNCTTRQVGEFRYDSGAHRLHDRDPEVTREVQGLLGPELRAIDVPSQIWDDGRLIRFPLSPPQLLAHLGPASFAKASLEVIRARLAPRQAVANFEDFALRMYGRTIASRFLLNYSEKLWGAPPAELSPTVAGNRLSGLDLRTFISETLLRRGSKSHVEGRFFYPRDGIGAIADALARECGADAIRVECPITRLVHDGEAIRNVEVGGGQGMDVDRVVSSLPLSVTLKILDPPPPAEILALADTIRYRQVRLVVLMVDRESITRAATVYFPDAAFPFTRISEPRNRSPEMAPEGKTSLLVEIPCHVGEQVWEVDDSELIHTVRETLIEAGLLNREEVMDGVADRLPNAYPVLDIHCDRAVTHIHDYLHRFHNLRLIGRSGRFVYGWIHNMMRFGMETVEDLVREAGEQ